MSTEKKEAKFSWNDKNTATATTMYTEKLKAEGAEIASSNDFLDEISVAINGLGFKSVRGKLSREGVYQKQDKPASQAKTNKVRKEHIVRAIANVLGMPDGEDDIDSLKNGKQDHLGLLAEKLGVGDVMSTAARDFERDPLQVVYAFMKVQDVELADLEDYALMVESENETPDAE